MIQNYEQIKLNGIITDVAEGNYNNGVYDIRIGKIITMKGDEVTTYSIPPQGMVVVVSKEKIKMPANIVGYAHVRTSLSSKGIMAINIGIIDPGYAGNLSSTLLNFGKEDFLLAQDERFLRTTFHLLEDVKIDRLSTSKSTDYENYMSRKKVETLKYMDEKFMSFDKEVKKSIKNSFKDFLGYASIISASIALLTYSYNILFPGPVKDYEKQVKINEINYNLLNNQYQLLKIRTDSLIHSK